MSIRAQTLIFFAKSEFLGFKVFRAPLGPMGPMGPMGPIGAHWGPWAPQGLPWAPPGGPGGPWAPWAPGPVAPCGVAVRLFTLVSPIACLGCILWLHFVPTPKLLIKKILQ